MSSPPWAGLARLGVDINWFQAQAEAREKAHRCSQYALFFNHLPSALVFLAPLFFVIVSAFLTAWIRSITPGVGDKPIAQPASTDVEATVIPEASGTPTALEAHADERDEPPPYQLPVTESAIQSMQRPRVKSSSAQLFMIGTVLLICTIMSLFLLALSIQSVIFCREWSPMSVFPCVILWTLFCIPCIWTSSGVTCWAVLLRGLWGPKMKKKYPIKDHALAFGLFCVVLSPFVLLWGVFGVGSVKAVEACQRRFCGDALDEESDDLGLADGGQSKADIDEDIARLIDNPTK